MRVFVISFGKLRTPGLRETADYYLKLLGGFVESEEIELKPLAVPDKSPGSRKLIQEKEGTLLLERLDKLLTPRGRVTLLEEGGRELSTLQWAHSIGEWEASATPAAAFCVGSSLGFSEAVRARSKGILSLGRQTLPHELARVVLYEQLYRAWSVTRGHPYHNEGS